MHPIPARTPEEIRKAAEQNIQVSLTPAEALGIFAELDRLRAQNKTATAAAREALRLLDDWQTAEELGTVEEWAVQISDTLARAHEPAVR